MDPSAWLAFEGPVGGLRLMLTTQLALFAGGWALAWVYLREERPAIAHWMGSALLMAGSIAALDATARTADPWTDNLLLARGPRHQLSAEALRDQALWASGLLVEQLGGPPAGTDAPTARARATASIAAASTRSGSARRRRRR